MMFDSKVLMTLLLVSQLGFAMLVPIFMMVWIGSWAAQRFSVRLFPLFLILGIAAGFRNSYILILKVLSKKKEEKTLEKREK